MTLRHFKTFITVCEKQNMSLAAGELFISQSAVSQAIADMESHYGFKLFERLSNKLYVTEKGNKLLCYARDIVAAGDLIEREMRAANQPLRAKIAVTPDLGLEWPARLISGYKKIHPEFDPVVYSLPIERIEKNLLLSACDFALIEDPLQAPELFIPRELFRDEVVFVCAENSRFLAHNGGTELRDLDKLPILLRERDPSRYSEFGAVLARAGFDLHINGVFNNAEAIIRAAALDIGIGLVPKSCVRPGSGVVIVRPKGIDVTRIVSLILHKDKFINSDLSAFIDYVCGQMAPRNEL